MAEETLNTHIGSEINVTVFYDYRPEEKQTYYDPGVDSLVTINAVYVDADESKDILEVLNNDWIETLESRCEESVKAEE